MTAQTPGQADAPVMHRLSGLIAGWRRQVRATEEGWPSDREAGHADALRDVLREVDGLLPDLTELAEAAYAAREPQPAPELAALHELLGMFRAVSGGWAARTSAGRLKRIAATAGVEFDPLQQGEPGEDGQLRGLIRDMLQAFPDTADEQEWRDRAGSLGVTDPDGQPYRAWTEEDIG